MLEILAKRWSFLLICWFSWVNMLGWLTYWLGTQVPSRLAKIWVVTNLVSERQVHRSQKYKSNVQQSLADRYEDVHTYLREAIGHLGNILFFYSLSCTLDLVEIIILISHSLSDGEESYIGKWWSGSYSCACFWEHCLRQRQETSSRSGQGPCCSTCGCSSTSSYSGS